MRYLTRPEIESIKAERRVEIEAAREKARVERAQQLTEAIRMNRHNFGQLREAGFPGVHPIEIMSVTTNTVLARMLETLLQYDVEYNADYGLHELVRRRRMLGYLMPAAYGSTRNWIEDSPADKYPLGLALTTDGSVYPVGRNNLGVRGCLIVRNEDTFPALGTVEAPQRLPREFSYHLYELTIHTLDRAGVEYQPMPEVQAEVADA